MQSKETKKIVYTDSGRDVAITGSIVEEDDYFLTVLSQRGTVYKIGKKAIVCIKEVQQP